MFISVGSVKVHLRDLGDRIVWHELRDGFEPETRAAWASLIQPGRAAVDIGAYTGLYAISAAKLGAKAVAIEAYDANVRRLRENIALNRVSVRVIPHAVGDKPSKHVSMYACGVSILPSGAKLSPNPGDVPYGKTSISKIDDLSLSDVAVLKIDIERHEPAAFRGAALFLRREKPVIIAEALGSDERDALLDVLGHNYTVTGVLDGRNLLLEPVARRP